MSSLADFAGLVATLGPQLEKVSVTEMIGERSGGQVRIRLAATGTGDVTDMSEVTLVEGLDLEEQGGLYVCQKCPNVVHLDLVNVNVSRKFFFGRRLEAAPGHFSRLRELSIGKVDWDTLKQVLTIAFGSRHRLV